MSLTNYANKKAKKINCLMTTVLFIDLSFEKWSLLNNSNIEHLYIQDYRNITEVPFSSECATLLKKLWLHILLHFKYTHRAKIDM